MIQLEPIDSFPVEEFLLTRLALSPDAVHLAIGHRQFRLLNVESGQTEREFAYADFLGRLCFSADGRFLAAANVADNHPTTRGHLSVFETATGALRYQASSPLPVETCAFAHNGAAQVAWNHAAPAQAGEQPYVAGAIARAGLEPAASLATLPLDAYQLRALAYSSAGFTCFVRESRGEAQTVEDANLVFRKFRLLQVSEEGRVMRDFDLGIGAGVCALSPDGHLLAVEMVDFKNNERHVSLLDAETGVEANLLPLEANTLPVFEFSQDGEYFLCLKEDAEGDFNVLRVWRTSDLRLLGEARLDLGYHAFASCLAHSTLAFLGGGKLDLFAIS